MGKTGKSSRVLCFLGNSMTIKQGRPRFSSVTVRTGSGSSGSGFGFRRFLWEKGALCVSVQFQWEKGSGSGNGS